MAKLPDYTQFGTPKFASGFKPLSAGQLDLSAPAKAMSKVAEGLDDVSSFMAKRGKEDEDRKDALNKLETDAAFKDEMRAFNNSFDNSTDYDNMEATHAKGSEAIVNKYASQIRDPDARVQWKANAQDTARNDNQRFHTIAKEGKEDKFIADTNATFEKRDAPLGNVGTTPSQIAEASQKTASDLKYLCDKGMISYTKCQQLGSEKKKYYKDLFIKSGILNDPVKTYDNVSWYGEKRGSRRMSTSGSVVLERKGPIKDMHAKSDVAEKAYGFFLSKGLAPYQAAALAGNMAWESGGNPFDVTKNDNQKNSPNSPHSTGIVQWNDRLPAAVAFWRKNGIDIPANIDLRNPSNVKAMIKMVPLEQQLAFAWHELQTTEKRAFDRVKSSRNLDEATAGAIGLHRPRGFTWSNPRGGHAFGQRMRIARMIESGYAVRGGETAAGKADVESGKLPPVMSEEDAARFAEMDSLFGDSSDAEINGYLEKFRRVINGNDEQAVNGMAARMFDTGSITEEDKATLERIKKTNKGLYDKAITGIKGSAYAASSRFGGETIGRNVPLDEMNYDELTEHRNRLHRDLKGFSGDPAEYKARSAALGKIDTEIRKLKELRRSDAAASVDNVKEVVAARDMRDFVKSTYGVSQEGEQPTTGELQPVPGKMAIPEGMAADLQGQAGAAPVAPGELYGIDVKAKQQEVERGIIEARLKAQEDVGVAEIDRRTLTIDEARGLLNYQARSGQDRQAREELKAALDDAYKRALEQVGDEALAGRMVSDAYFLTAKRQESKAMKSMARAYGDKGKAPLSPSDEARKLRAEIDEFNLDFQISDEAPALSSAPPMKVLDQLRANLNDPNYVKAFVNRYGSNALQKALTEPNSISGTPSAPDQQGVDRFGNPQKGGYLNNLFK